MGSFQMERGVTWWGGHVNPMPTMWADKGTSGAQRKARASCFVREEKGNLPQMITGGTWKSRGPWCEPGRDLGTCLHLRGREGIQMVSVMDINGKASMHEGQGFEETRGHEGCVEACGVGRSRLFLHAPASEQRR